MERIGKYFAWNAMVVGTLVLSSIFKFDIMITILGWFFGIEAAVYFAAVLISNKEQDKFANRNKHKLETYKCFFEPIYIFVAFWLGHNYIAICMFVSFLGYVYLLFHVKQILKSTTENKAC